jgi:hypothetical protein
MKKDCVLKKISFTRTGLFKKKKCGDSHNVRLSVRFFQLEKYYWADFYEFVMNIIPLEAILNSHFLISLNRNIGSFICVHLDWRGHEFVRWEQQ